MRDSMWYNLLLLMTTAIYFTSSSLLFNKIYDTIEIVIDELFHLQQGLEYCKHNFTYWNPKITTLPGLYLVSTVLLSPKFSCNTHNLRYTNLLGSCVNLFLFASILKYVYGYNDESKSKIVLQALSMALLPPLYFFSHVYYTDTLSLMFLLAFSHSCLVNRHKLLIFLFGVWSILMRQTNVVWVAMIFGHKVLDILIRSSRVYGNHYLTKSTINEKSPIYQHIDSSKLKRYYNISDVFTALMYHLRNCFFTFLNFLTLQDCLLLFTHTLIITSFLVFVIFNGSIVLGDKEAHQATIHIPQIFYFSIFYGIFGLPYVLASITSTLKLIFKHKFKVIVLGILFGIIVQYNTIVHPYLLADNRHYTFYVWNRWFGKYDFAKYVMIPAYIFLLFNLYDNLKDHNCISFLLPYSISLFLALALQKMIEIRYFLIPYIILRLRFVRPTYKMVLFELFWYIVLNAVTFYIFFNKEVIWTDFDYVQRIIW